MQVNQSKDPLLGVQLYEKWSSTLRTLKKFFLCTRKCYTVAYNPSAVCFYSYSAMSTPAACISSSNEKVGLYMDGDGYVKAGMTYVVTMLWL